MKITAEKVLDFHKEIRLRLAGLIDTLRSGDDGLEESIQTQIGDIEQCLNVFRVEQLTKVTPKPKGQPYLLKAEKALEKTDGNTVDENIAIFKSRLYAFIKRNLRQLDLLAVKNEQLYPYIEDNCIIGSDFEKFVYSDEWFNISRSVISDITDEIIDQRKKAPQLSITFPDTRKRKRSNLLVDII